MAVRLYIKFLERDREKLSLSTVLITFLFFFVFLLRVSSNCFQSALLRKVILNQTGAKFAFCRGSLSNFGLLQKIALPLSLVSNHTKARFQDFQSLVTTHNTSHNSLSYIAESQIWDSTVRMKEPKESSLHFLLSVVKSLDLNNRKSYLTLKIILKEVSNELIRESYLQGLKFFFICLD